MGSQRALPASGLFQMPSAQNHQYAKVAYLEVAYFEPLSLFRPERNLFSGSQDLPCSQRIRLGGCNQEQGRLLTPASGHRACNSQSLALSLGDKGTDFCLPGSFWEPQVSWPPSPECTLPAAVPRPPLLGTQVFVPSWSVGSPSHACSLAAGETGKVGFWLLFWGCADTSGEIFPWMQKGFLKVLDDCTSWQMSPPQLFSQPSRPSSALDHSYITFKNWQRGDDKCSVKFPTPRWRDREAGANVWLRKVTV